MDNLSHTLVGLGAAELLARSLPAEADPARQRGRHRLLLLACALASNFPDLDLLLTPLLAAPLGYLLHHRGHTHTLLFALPQALLLAALLWLAWPAARTLLRASAPARRGLAISIGLGFGLHLLMDYSNSYGLHPFYPFDARWLYGDMVFIVEPLYWICLGAPLLVQARARLLRAGGLAMLAALPALFCWRGYLTPAAAAVLLALGVLLALLQRRDGARGRRALLLALTLCAGFVGLQGYASSLARQRISATLNQLDPHSRVLDVALTAFPSMPLCWNVVSVESEAAADRYRLRRGVLSLAPRWLAPQDCPAGLQPLSTAGTRLTPALLQAEQRDASLSALRRLQRENCQVDAWLRFARMPALDGGVASDFRFAGVPGGNFSALPYASMRALACPSGVPGWGYPRAELLAAPR